MKIIEISVENKIAKTKGNPNIVCNNTDYSIKFTFDKEWASEPLKTARFVYNGVYEDVVFDGDTCKVPLIDNTQTLSVGVFAGNLRTTTPAYINCKYSILQNGTQIKEPTKDVYAQIMELLNKYIEQGGGGGGFTKDEIENIIKEYLEENPIEDGKDGKDGFSPTVMVEQIENGNRVYITDINGTKQFDVLNGKDGESPSIDLTEYQKKTDEGLKTDSKSIIGAINELFDRPTSGGSDTTEGNYELIEKVVIGYSITTAQPEDWATNYTAYFTNTGTQKEPIYTAVSGDTAPTWQAGTYYSFDGTTKVVFKRNKTPNGEPYQFKKLTFVSVAPQGEQVTGYVSMVTDYKIDGGWEYGSMVNVQRFSQTNNVTQTVAEARIENGKIFLYGFYGGGVDVLSILGNNIGQGSTSFSARRWITRETNANYITRVEANNALIPNTEVYIFAVK